MNKEFYIVKRNPDSISVYQRDREIGSIPRDAVLEIEDDNGTYFIQAVHMNDADLVAYILKRSKEDQ